MSGSVLSFNCQAYDCMCNGSVCTYLVDCLALVLLIPGPFLHEGIQQQPPHMDDCQAGVGSGLLH